MKPDFALSLSFEGISLLSRSDTGWLRVGEAALDAGDLGPELAQIRDLAEEIANGPIQSKVIIPAEQIKFLSIPAPEDDAEVQDAITAALDGATPYAVEDLAFDWQADGGMLRIAAVARETLAEAEGFAAMHGFGPVCFVATPQEKFPTEVFFGATEAGQSLNPERDAEPLRVVGVFDPAPTLETAQEAEPEPQPQPDVVHEMPTEPGVAPTSGPERDETGNDAQDEARVTAEDTPAEPEAPVEPAPVFASMRRSEEPRGTEPETVQEVGQEAVQTPTPSDEKGQSTTTVAEAIEPLDLSRAAAAREPEPLAPEPEPDPEPSAPEPPPFVAVPAGGVADHAAPGPDRGSSPLDRVREAAGALPFFGSRRKSADALRADPSPPAPTASFASMRGGAKDSDGTHAPRLAGVQREGAGLTAGHLPVPGRAPEPQLDDTPRIEHIPEPPAFETVSDKPVPAAAVPTATPAASAPSRLRWRKKARPTEDAETEAARRRERERMTVFGARKKAEVGGKPRFLGLMLTAALLVFLAGVAAWASIYVEDGLARFFTRDPSPSEIALTPDEFEEISLADGPVMNAPDAPDEGAVVVASLGNAPDTATVLDRAAPTLRAQPNLPTIEEPLDPAEAEAQYAATGIWQMAPVEPSAAEAISLEDIYVASIDGSVQPHDAVALPPRSGLLTDVAMKPQRLPPAAGVRYRVDNRGLFVPTPEGVETPQGYTLYAGRPALLPRLRPGSEDGSDIGAIARPSEIGQRALDAEQTRLAALRPRLRPGDLVEQGERDRLGGLSLSELGGIRPRLRPQSAQEAAQAAARASAEAAEAEARANQEAAVADAVEEAQQVEVASALAVASSRMPRNRPGNLAKRFERQKKQAETTQVAAVAPRSVKPKIPSKATVARQATIKNAINLRKVNLIGVYGKPSSRRALVRLSSGRYKKVKVGDRIDGGRVSAIGDGELRYTKGGRSVTLKMPRG